MATAVYPERGFNPAESPLEGLVRSTEAKFGKDMERAPRTVETLTKKGEQRIAKAVERADNLKDKLLNTKVVGWLKRGAKGAYRGLEVAASVPEMAQAGAKATKEGFEIFMLKPVNQDIAEQVY